MIPEMLFGGFIGIFLILFIAWVDSKYLNMGIKVPESRFKSYIVASCWEALFFIGGFLLGKWVF